MIIKIQAPDALIIAGANWSVLEQMFHQFNYPGLDAIITLRRTLMLRNLQLCLSVEHHGSSVTIFSESFEDAMVTEAAQKDRLVSLVSRFLLKVKNLQERRYTALTEAASTPTVVDAMMERSDTKVTL